jgi:hypothetical protein
VRPQTADRYRYQIRIMGQLDPSWAECFSGAEIVWDDDGNTVLSCELLDHAALQGVLNRLFDLNSLLLSVTKEPRA